MGASETAPIDGETIKAAYHAALWDVRPRSAAETETLVLQLEGHVRLLAPEVAARVPTMNKSTGDVALVALRHADEVLDPATRSADRAGRLLHDLGVVARALLTLVEMTGAPEPDVEPADPTGWLLIVGPPGAGRMQQQWVTGDCWLGCGRTCLMVIWLGPVQWDGQHAPFYACADCLARLKAQALAHFVQRQPA